MPMLAREHRRPDGRPSEEPRVIFSAPWSQTLFASGERKGWGVRARRAGASFVTTRDVSGGTSGRKQLDDLSTPTRRATANDFIDVFFHGNVTDLDEIRGRWYGRARAKAPFSYAFVWYTVNLARNLRNATKKNQRQIQNQVKIIGTIVTDEKMLFNVQR